MAENNIVKQKGRIFYVDPNDVFGSGGDNGDVPLTPPYEDMSIAFNLIIEKYDRFDNKKRSQMGLCWCDKLSGDGHYNVLNGSISDKNGIYDSQGNRYLSTYYVDISADGYNRGEQIEGLGVSSIQVSFDSYYTPTVVIKFVDVRGSALFGREEAIHTSASGNGEINSSNVFGSFFTIPYPKFRLQIKGFFGKAVTYQLTVSNFKANFNAQTGNVEATVQFVGYTWALLTDIPLQYLVAAPYCNYGGQEYWNEHKTQQSWLLTGDVEPPKLYELFTVIRSCIHGSERPGSDSEDDDDASLHNDNSDAQLLIDNIDNIKQFLTDSDTIANHMVEIDTCFNHITVGVENLSDVIDTSKKPSEPYTKKITTVKGITQTKYVQNSFDDLRTEVNQLIEGNNIVLEKNRNLKESEFIEKSVSAIGFIPNIYNIFKILMCHLETFCHILFKAGKEIEQQGNGRLASALGVKNNNTDLPARLDLEKQKLPAWTVIFNRSNSSTQTVGELKYTDMYQWVGTIAPNKWVEERVVWSLQNAIQYVAKDQESNTSPIIRKINYIPVLPCDILNTNAPFNDSVNNGFQTFVGHLSLRIAQILGVMDTGLTQDNTMLDTVAKADAYNFFYSCQNIDNIKTLITENTREGNAADIISGMAVCDKKYDKKATVDKITGKSFYVYEDKPNVRGCIEGRHNIFKLNNNSYDYTYFLNEEYKYYVPTKLVPFTNNGYSTFIESKTVQDKTVYNGVILNKKSNKWLTNASSKEVKECLNYDEFKIIDNENDIKQLEEIYEAVKNNSFKVNEYTPPTDELSSFVERYWKISFEDYKKHIPQLPDYFIGKSYVDYFDSQNPKPNKNVIIKDFEKVNRAVRGTTSKETIYNTLGDEYNKIGSDSIDDFFIKMLYVWDQKGHAYGTLFGHPFYYTQNQITDEDKKLCAKACLFLQSLRRSEVSFDHNLHTAHGAFGIYNKLNILYIGSLLWRQRNVDKDKEGHHKDDGIKYTNPKGGPQYQSYVKDGKALTMGGTLGLFIAKSDQKLPGDCVDIDEYITKTSNSKLYSNLNDNVKTQLIEYFKKFATIDFKKITHQCEQYNEKTKLVSDGTIYQQYLNDNKDKFAQTPPPKALKENMTYKGESYAFSCFYTEDNTDGLYLVFDEDGSKKNGVQDKIKDVVFGKVVLMNSCAVGKAKKNISIPSSAFKGYINGFVNKLNEIVSGLTTGADYSSTNLTDGEEYDENLLLAIYLYCKNIWEKWLMPLSRNDLPTDDDGSKHFDVSVFFEKNFKFIDTYYNDIGKLLKINLDKLLKKYEARIDNGSLFAFIGDIAAEHRCLFVGLPDFVDLGLGVNGKFSEKAVKNLENMFRPVPFNQMEIPQLNNNFVVIYTYPPAKQLPDSAMYRYDGFDIYSQQDDKVLSVFKTDGATEQISEIGYNIPAFGVCFAKQNNYLFKDLNISMDNPMETEQSLNTLWHVSKLAKGHYGKVCFYGQDVYNIFSNYSYQIEVEMMGNAQIQPLMYFQLLNIPMWRGAYMIFNVSHTMTPGNMITKFKGMKMSKNPVPILSKYWSIVKGTKGTDENVNNIYSDGDTAGDIVGDYDATDFIHSGTGDTIKNNGASGRDLDVYRPPKGYSSAVSQNYYNRGSNNYYMPQLSTYTFRMSKGQTFNLKHAINFIYNMAHLTTTNISPKGKPPYNENTRAYKAFTQKPPTKSSHMCARHVWNALGAGGLVLRRDNAWGNGTHDAMSNNGGYELIYDGKGKNRLPKYAMPGDVVLKMYYRGPEKSGHAEFFTGKHWVSDAIQPSGLKWAPGNTSLDYAISRIYAIWRIPGIEKALVGTSRGSGGSSKPSSGGGGSIKPPSNGKSIFETNMGYSYNAICQPNGKFHYNRANLESCVVYFVANGEGGNRNLTGTKSTDYCGINVIHKSFYTPERTKVLNRIGQNGFYAAYDKDVFDFYDNYLKNYKDFFESCQNPFTRYMGLLALKAGPGYYAEGWRRMGGENYKRLSELDYTRDLADNWINVIKYGYTYKKHTYPGYGDEKDNPGYWKSVKSAEEYNRIFKIR